MHNLGLVGANGFIGTSLKSSSIFSEYDIQSFGRKDLITSDLNFQDMVPKLDSIIWAASLTNPSIAEVRPDLVDLELEHWQYFLEKLSTLKSAIPKLLFISSGGCVYSGDKSYFEERDEAYGSNAYGRLKSRMEQALIDSGLRHSIIRAANIYGPNQPTGRGQGVVAEWVNAAKFGSPINLYGDSQVHRDFLYITDFLESLKLVLESEVCHTVNVGSGKSESLATVINALQTHSQIPLNISYFPARGYDRRSYRLDISLANNCFGWTPRISLDRGIAKCFSSDLD
jgi:UDP-glucose 4-epimerase